MRKIISLALLLAMALTLAAGAETLKEGEFAGYPIAGGGTLTLWTTGLAYHNDYTSEDESPYHQFIEEATGVDIQWKRAAAGADATQAYNLMIATNDLPDIIYKGGLPAEVEVMLLDGIFQPLDDYMQYAPALSAYLAEHPETEKAIRSDSGSLYVFPFLREDVAWLGSTIGSSVNSAMLEQANLDMPVTLADWEEMLYAFKELEDCDFPMSLYRSHHPLWLFGNAFHFNGYDRYSLDENGEVATWMNAEGYYDFLVTMNKWYEDGLIDPDFISMDLIGFVSKFVANKVGSTVYGTATPARFYNAIIERDGSWDYLGAVYPVAEVGDEVLYSQGEPLWTGTGAVITTACQNIPLAMRFLDYGYTDEGIITWNYGKEGVSYYYDENGKRRMMDWILNAEEGATLCLSRYTALTSTGITIMSLEWNRGKSLDVAIALTDAWTANAEKAALHRWPPVCATVEENAELANIESALTTYADEMYINFLIGAEPLDKFDEYLENLNKMGIDRVLEIKAEQLARYNNR